MRVIIYNKETYFPPRTIAYLTDSFIEVTVGDWQVIAQFNEEIESFLYSAVSNINGLRLNGVCDSNIKTIEEALVNAVESMELSVESDRNRKHSPPKPIL